METLVPVFAVAVAVPGGWFAGSFQHWLYRESEFRAAPASGRSAWMIRGGLAIACAVVAAIAFRPGHYDFAPALLTALFGLALCVMASTDFERRRITNSLSYPAALAALAFAWAWPDRSVVDILYGGGFAAGLGAVLFGLGLLVGGPVGGLGIGDIKLIVIVGLLLGWPVALYGLFIGMLAAGVPSVILLAQGKGKAHFSYGPYLALGAIVGLLWPERFM